MKSSGINLLHANGDLYALFALFRAEMKWNKLVTWKWTRFAWFALFRAKLKMEQACCMRLDSVTRGSHCLDWKKLVAREWTWFPIVRTVGAQTYWNKLVAWQWTLLCQVPNVWGWNQVELTYCTRMDTVTHGDHVEQACYMPIDTFTRGSPCLELKQCGWKLLHANGHCYMRFLMFGDEIKWN